LFNVDRTYRTDYGAIHGTTAFILEIRRTEWATLYKACVGDADHARADNAHNHNNTNA
jgi:hypothetical protein